MNIWEFTAQGFVAEVATGLVMAVVAAVVITVVAKQIEKRAIK